jgi:hypothetical protein
MQVLRYGVGQVSLIVFARHHTALRKTFAAAQLTKYLFGSANATCDYLGARKHAQVAM